MPLLVKVVRHFCGLTYQVSIFVIQPYLVSPVWNLFGFWMVEYLDILYVWTDLTSFYLG